MQGPEEKLCKSYHQAPMVVVLAIMLNLLC